MMPEMGGAVRWVDRAFGHFWAFQNGIWKVVCNLVDNTLYPNLFIYYTTSFTGDLDTCIYIRSAVVKDGRVHVQAGAGIVADSNPDYEVRETEAKAQAVWNAIALACAQGDWA